VHVIVVGCGRVGSSLAETLSRDGHSVVVVDRRPEPFHRLPAGFDGTTLVGIGFDRDVLKEAGVEHAAAVAAVTSGDNSNILTARIARENFAIERVVARIYDPRRATIYQRLGIATVATVAWTTDQVVRRMLPDPTGAEWTDPTAHVGVVERQITKPWIGRPVSDLEEELGVRLVAVRRVGSALVPSPRTVGQEGDLLYVSVVLSDVEAFDRAFQAGGLEKGGH
jgi:trk/ktr system potassium uptake protein